MATTPSMTAFERDTAVAPAGDGVWHAEIGERWTVPNGGPNGGYVAALMLRALAGAVTDPDRVPRSLTLHYLRAPVPGRPAQIHVAVERAGRSLTSLSARMIQDDRVMVLALAAFASDYPTAVEYAAPALDVGPPPAELHTVAAGASVPEMAHRIASAPLFGPGSKNRGDEAVVGGWLRLAEPRVADAAAVALYADAWLPAPLALLRTPAPAPTIDLTIHFRTRLPHPGMTPETPVLARFSSSTSHGGFFEEDGAIWAPDGTLLAQSRQLALLLPIA